jgi:hypothetical protein
MRLLLDTHIFLWWDAQPEKLSPGLLAALREPSNSAGVEDAGRARTRVTVKLSTATLVPPRLR